MIIFNYGPSREPDFAIFGASEPGDSRLRALRSGEAGCLNMATTA